MSALTETSTGIPVTAGSSLRGFLHGLPGVDQVGAEARAGPAGQPVDQDHGQGVGDRPRDLDDRPDHARGRGHARQGPRPVRQGAPPGPGRPDALRRSPRSASTPTWSPPPRPTLAGTGIHVASVATAFPAGRAALAVKLADTADAVAAGADEIDMVIDRGAFLSGHYLDVFDEIVAVKRAPARTGAPQGDPRDRRAGHATTTCAAPPGWRCWPAPTSSRPPPARSRPPRSR